MELTGGKLENGIRRYTSDADTNTAAWSRQWRMWDDLWASPDLARRTEEKFGAAFGMDPKAMPAGTMILDAGCGAGRNAWLFAGLPVNVLAIDASRSVDYAMQRYPADNITFAQASLYDVPSPDGTFDLIFSDGVLIHVPDIGAAVEHLASKLKPGGKLAIAVAGPHDSRQERNLNRMRHFTVDMNATALHAFCGFLSALYPLTRLPIVGNAIGYMIPEHNPNPEWRRCYIHDYLAAPIRERQTWEAMEAHFKAAGLVEIENRSTHEIRIVGRKP